MNIIENNTVIENLEVLCEMEKMGNSWPLLT